jgi:hypothetical protein
MTQSIANFINRDTSIMSSVHEKPDGTFIVHLADLELDYRFPPSRIFKTRDLATHYAEFVVGKAGVRC